MRLFRLGVATLCVFALPACGTHGGSNDAPRERSTDSGATSPASEGPSRLCARPAADTVHDVFCGDTPPEIHGLRDLEELLQLAIGPPQEGSPSGYTDAGATAVSESAYEAVTLLGHSTALSGQLVSPINPRALILGPNTFLAFNRGIQQVEIASVDRDTVAFNFYLVSFTQACNRASHGCSPGDRFTPRIESNWLDVTARDAEDLKNTPSDCRQCHQRARETSLLLMRELHGPWTHFFLPDQDAFSSPEPTGVDLMHDYLNAKGDESYAGVPTKVLRETLGITLEGVVPVPQPLVFDGTTILTERWVDDANGDYSTTPKRSPTWYAAYNAFKRGEQLALPYFDPRPTDPDKQQKLTAAYRSYLANESTADDLPDLADIFPDDPQVRAEIGLQTEPGASPAEALVQACGSCHNDVLDQSISRARFSIALSKMNRAELNVAIARLEADRDAPGAMPPPGRRQLDDEGRKALLDYLKRDVRSTDADALLDRAAQLGMAGGQQD
jgi:mono/diheme cytochrome c family protein